MRNVTGGRAGKNDNIELSRSRYLKHGGKAKLKMEIVRNVEQVIILAHR